ncbi:ABC transporter substrate-binding protein [Actinomadura sp. HBU206391]|uniref:ABC transporter substrate-binding protein n=1 Tax=Actinomadura sp. HBU206391 TaxID=2731692 RepID=UPI001650596B|nr:ABC transporter substrate-binding protein [Actinomadura sp. HBU206391]MBC6459279.1 amino acid ABC transporter substrate-binding protein [Actinomadura sp. HBU206391]
MRIWPGSRDVKPEHGRRPRVLALGVAITAVVLASACGSSDSGDSSSPSAAPPAAAGVKLVTPGKLKVCTNVPYPPFQFPQGNKTVGFDVDIVDLVAKKIGAQQEIISMDFNVIKSGAALNANRCDVAAAGMTILPERKQNLDFSRPYFPEYLALMTKKGAGVKTVEDAKAKGLKVGVQADTTSLDLAKSKGLTPTEYKDSGKELLAIQSGAIDVALQDLPVVNDWMKNPDVSSKFEVAAEISTGAQYGIAVKKGGNPALLKLIDDTITEAIKDGTWTRIYKQWIGSEPKSMPADS